MVTTVWPQASLIRWWVPAEASPGHPEILKLPLSTSCQLPRASRELLPCAPPLRPPLSRPPLRKEPCYHRSDSTRFWVLREIVPVLTRRDSIANAPGRAQGRPLLIAWANSPALLNSDWWLFVPDYNGQQCSSLFHSPCHFSVSFPNLLDCSKKQAQWRQQAKPISAFWLLTERVWTEGCPVFPWCPVLFHTLHLPSIHPQGNGDQEKWDRSRVKAVSHSFLTQLPSLLLPAFPPLSLLLSLGSYLWDALPTWLEEGWTGGAQGERKWGCQLLQVLSFCQAVGVCQQDSWHPQLYWAAWDT